MFICEALFARFCNVSRLIKVRDHRVCVVEEIERTFSFSFVFVSVHLFGRGSRRSLKDAFLAVCSLCASRSCGGKSVLFANLVDILLSRFSELRSTDLDALEEVQFLRKVVFGAIMWKIEKIAHVKKSFFPNSQSHCRRSCTMHLSRRGGYLCI
jgi:hypothetical protein